MSVRANGRAGFPTPSRRLRAPRAFRFLPMSARRPVILVLCAIGLIALAAYAWHANRGALPTQPAHADAAEAARPAVVDVETVAVATRSMPDDVTAVGTLVSNESVILRPEVAGRIARIQFREGAPVRRGAVLVELDAALQLAELQQAKASLALAEIGRAHV